MNSKPKVPKDLGVKIGSKKEAFWTKVLEETKAQLEAAENAAMYQKEIIKIAEKKIAIEKENWKKS